MLGRLVEVPTQSLIRWGAAAALAVAALNVLPFVNRSFEPVFEAPMRQSEPGFSPILPQRGMALQSSSGTLGSASGTVNGPAPTPVNPSGLGADDSRLGQSAPGMVASLGAVFPSSMVFDTDGDGTTDPGFFIYAIDPVTGAGRFAFAVSGAEVNAALAEAAASGSSVLIAPDDGSYPQLYALPSNECALLSLTPDGKVFQIVFDCAS